MHRTREKGLTLIEVALAAMVSTVIMLSVWLQLQDIIRFYVSRNLSYTILQRFDDVIAEINLSCLTATDGSTCDKDSIIETIQNESSSGGESAGELNVKIKERSGGSNAGFDIWMTYKTPDLILSHIDKQAVINATAFYSVVPYENDAGIIQYYYSPVIPWSVEADELLWLVDNNSDILIFHYFLGVT
ncbi:TPA: hypothetical protein IGZ65_004406 [Escherichia coli]|nr:hypothetical protein [Escherichia coli]